MCVLKIGLLTFTLILPLGLLPLQTLQLLIFSSIVVDLKRHCGTSDHFPAQNSLVSSHQTWVLMLVDK